MEQLLKNILENPINARAHWELGKFYEGNGAMMKAISQFRTSITLGNNTPQAHIMLACAYLMIGRINSGIEICEQIISSDFEDSIKNYAVELINMKNGFSDYELTNIDHNTYYRLKTITNCILENTTNKHCSILDIGGGDGKLSLFLPDAYYALIEPSVNGLSAPVPFIEKSFDFVVCCHVFEHIPIQDRNTFLDYLCSIAKEKVILLNPYETKNSAAWLNLTYDITKAGWAKEHIDCVMPHIEEIKQYVESKGYSYKITPNGSESLTAAFVFFDYFAHMSGKTNEVARIYKEFNTLLSVEELINNESPNAYLVEIDVD